MKMNIEKTLSMIDQIMNARGHELKEFVARQTIDDLEMIRKENLQNLFTIAKKYKVRYLYVGRGEIAGCEKILQPGSPWPAIWAIAEQVGFPGSCGNSDQYQCYRSDVVFPEDSFGGWDLATDKKLSDNETMEMKFSRVVTR